MQDIYILVVMTKGQNVHWFSRDLLISSPLHFCFIIANIIAFLALGQHWYTAKLLVVVVDFVLGLEAFYGI